MKNIYVKSVLTLALSLSGLFGSAGTTTWLGGTGVWNLATNWNNGIPNGANSAVFDGTSTTYCSINQIAVNTIGISIAGTYTGNISIDVANKSFSAGDFTMGGPGSFSCTGGTAPTFTFGNFTLTNGTFNSQNKAIQINGNFNIGSIAGGKFTSTNKNITATGAFTLSSGGTYIDGSTALKVASVSLAAGATFNLGSGNTTVTATPSTWADGGATVTTSSSTVTFSGSGTNTITGLENDFNNLIFFGTLIAPPSLVIKGNLTNNGIFSSGGSLVTFNGGVAQSVSGSANYTGASAFFDIIVQGGATALTFNKNVDLLDRLDFTGQVASVNFSGSSSVFTLISSGTMLSLDNTAQIGNTNSSTLTGNITWQRWIDGYTDWRMLACPVTGATIASWSFATEGFTGASGGSTGFVSVYTYTATAGYVAATSSGESISGNTNGGFLAYVGNTSPGTVMSPRILLSISGPPINGDGAGTPTLIDASGTGFNMVSNPYPAAIDFSQLQTSGDWQQLNSTYTVYDSQSGSYDTWDQSGGGNTGGTGSTSTTGIIASGQAFFVQSSGTSPSITFKESYKSTGSGDLFLRKGKPKTATATPIVDSYFHLIVNDTMNSYQNGVIVAFGPSWNDAFNAADDTRKMHTSTYGAPDISVYSSDNVELCIDKMASITSNLSIPVRVLVSLTGKYTITASDLLTKGPTACVILEDKLTHTMTSLSTTPSYTFTISDTTTVARFVLHISTTPVSVLTQSNAPVCNAGTDGSLIAAAAGVGPWTYAWLDKNGVALQTSVAITTADTLKGLSAGNYSVLVTDKGACSHTASQSFTLVAPPAIIAAFIPSVTTLNINDSVKFTNASTGANFYVWNFGDGSANDTTLLNPFHKFISVGNDTVKLMAYFNSCSPGLTKQVVHILNPLGINNLSNSNGLSITSNANGAFLQLNFDQTVNGTIEVFDILGNSINSQAFSGSKNTERIDLPSNLSAGIYLVRVFTSQETISRRIFIGH